MKRIALALLAAVLALSAPQPARAQGVEAPDREGDGAFAASRVVIPGRIAGDAMIMAGSAQLDGEVGDDARVLAGRYKQSGAVGGELAIAAQSAEIDGPVGDDLYVAANDVRLGSDARIGQDARIFGQDVLVKGRIDGNLDVSGESVALDAQVGGDVTINAREIFLSPNATIEGRLIWRSPTPPDIPPEAIVHRGVSGEVIKGWRREGVLTWAMPWKGAPRAVLYAGEAAVRITVALSAFLLGLLLVLLTPHYADRVFNVLRARWPAALGWGAAILLLTPVLAFVIMLSLVGFPLGFLMLLAWPLLALCGYALGAGALAALALKPATPGARVIALAAGLAALTVLSFAPAIGWMFAVAATFLGLGALALAVRPRLQV
ncbi:MAG: hypothetical protein AB7M12_13560 [Hyphomonadaceae bacterium]